MKILNKILSSVLAFMVAAMVVVCCWQVITRFVLGNPSKYTEEILRFALIWLTMLGAPYAYGAKQEQGNLQGTGNLGGDRDCAQLSDGQRQLVHLARLAVQDAPILLLDEPNSALDFENTGLLFRRVRELVETGERTALIVLHDPALALRWCRRLLLLAGGRLVDNVATEGMGAEALQAVLRQLYPTIQVRWDESGRFYCLPD